MIVKITKITTKITRIIKIIITTIITIITKITKRKADNNAGMLVMMPVIMQVIILLFK